MNHCLLAGIAARSKVHRQAASVAGDGLAHQALRQQTQFSRSAGRRGWARQFPADL